MFKQSWKSWKAARHVLVLAVAASALTTAGVANGQAAPRSALPDAGLAGRPGELTGVYCTSATDCWAVGDQPTPKGRLNQVLHWAGQTWVKVTVPEPGGTGKGDENGLSAVRCTSKKNCWAVGNYEKAGHAILDQILRWNGTKWSVMSAPTPAGVQPNDRQILADVACISASKCWAVGQYSINTNAMEVIFNQALRWNGSSWSLVDVQNPGGNTVNHVSALVSVRCTARTSCWAAGTYGTTSNPLALRNQLLHWNGKTWTREFIPDPGGTMDGVFNQLNDLSCTSAKNCLAVGTLGRLTTNNMSLNEILRWNGTKWLEDTVPNPDGTGPAAGNGLLGTTCASASDCWAVGRFGGSNGGSARGEVLRWNGTKWVSVTTPEPGGGKSGDSSVLNAIRCITPTNCWAVGVQHHGGGPDLDNALHWNGTKWQVG